VQGHFSRLVDFVVVDVVESGAVLAAWADAVEASFAGTSFGGVLELEDSLELRLH
jgi:hypothetical protein